MKKYLKSNGIIIIIVASANIIIELLIQHYMVRSGNQEIIYLQSVSGIILKNLFCLLAGVLALYSVRKGGYRILFYALLTLTVLAVMVVMLTTQGTFPQRLDALINLTSIPMVTLLYSSAMLYKFQKQWEAVISVRPVGIDLRLNASSDWFNPIQIGPRFAINSDYVDIFDRYIASIGAKSPLVINLYCTEPVSEMMQDTMQETLRMNYEEEEARIRHDINVRHFRVLNTFAISLILIVIWKMMNLLFEDVIYWEIVGNIAAFGLWQVGYTFYEERDLFDDLVRNQIGKFADVVFIQDTRPN